jgi:DNA-binding HxlR family transcriptional regulator
MDVDDFLHGTCGIGRAAARIGDLWSLMILRDAGLGLKRFDQFQKSLGIAPNILSRRLAALVGAGLLVKRRYSERPPRDEYVLTECGRAALPPLQALAAWAAASFGPGTSRLVDAATGAPVEPIVVDRATGRPLAEMKLKLVLPGEAPDVL